VNTSEFKKRGAGIAEKRREAKHLILQLAQVVDSLQSIQRIQQDETQLREITETTAKLELLKIPIPEGPGRLATLVSRSEELSDLLEFIAEELGQLHVRVRGLHSAGSRKAIERKRRHPVSSEGEFSRHERSEKRRNFREFWKGLLALPEAQTPFHSNLAASERNWITIRSGFGGLIYAYGIYQHHGRVELYIDRGNANANTEVFDELHSHKQEIETEFGEPLLWERLETKRACRISYHLTAGGYYDDEARWPAIQTSMIKAMDSFTNAIAPTLRRLGLPKGKGTFVQ
jgi:hypothetical protein